MFLDSKLAFKEHIRNVLDRNIKTIGLVRKLPNILPRPPLIITCKSFLRPYLKYANIVYDQVHNDLFH